MFLKPDYNLKNVYEINFEELKQNDIKCIMFDLDSTVMRSKSATFEPETLEWFNGFLKDFEVAIISNNKNENYIWDECVRLAGKIDGDSNEGNPGLYDILSLIDYYFN